MANGINNKYEYRSGLLDSLNVQHTASDVRNEDEYRKKVLNGLGVEYTEDDINQKNLYRAKVVEGLASSGGGGGESDFSTATLTITNTTKNSVIFEVPSYRDGGEVLSTRAIVLGALGDKPARATANVVCKSNGAILTIVTESVTATTSGDIQYIEAEHLYIITGDCAITVSGSQAV